MSGHEQDPPAELSLAGSVVDKAIEYMMGQNVPPVAIASALLGGSIALLSRTLDDNAICGMALLASPSSRNAGVESFVNPAAATPSLRNLAAAASVRNLAAATPAATSARNLASARGLAASARIIAAVTPQDADAQERILAASLRSLAAATPPEVDAQVRASSMRNLVAAAALSQRGLDAPEAGRASRRSLAAGTPPEQFGAATPSRRGDGFLDPGR